MDTWRMEELISDRLVDGYPSSDGQDARDFVQMPKGNGAADEEPPSTDDEVSEVDR